MKESLLCVSVLARAKVLQLIFLNINLWIKKKRKFLINFYFKFNHISHIRIYTYICVNDIQIIKDFKTE